MSDQPKIRTTEDAATAAYFREHDLASLRQAHAKILEAVTLLEDASICLDAIPAGMAAKDGANAPHLVALAFEYAEQSASILEHAINAR